ncbi:MAG: ABC transporter substrate-binding protein [Campylobacterota bacterium]|nr:ABC transporter substrate-binding protein [Campylobacterota bacterium]
MKILLLISILILSLFANDAKDLQNTMQKKSDAIISILKNNKLTKENKYDNIDKEINNLFNYNIMAMLSIGKKGRKLLNPTQKKEFTTLFMQHIKNSYFEKSDLILDKKIVMKSSKEEKKRIFVLADIVGPKDTSELIYKFHKHQKRGWLIYDVEISGVSIISSYRTQFKEILKDNNPHKLIDILR